MLDRYRICITKDEYLSIKKAAKGYTQNGYFNNEDYKHFEAICMRYEIEEEIEKQYTKNLEEDN